MRQPHSFFPVDSLRAAPTSSLWFGAMTLLSGSCMVEVVHVGLVHVSGVLDHCAVKQRAQRHSISSLDYVSFPCHHSDDRSCCCWHAWFLLRFPANHLVRSTFATRPCISRRGPPATSRLTLEKARFLCAYCFFLLTCVHPIGPTRSLGSNSPHSTSHSANSAFERVVFPLPNVERKRGKKGRNWE